MPGPKVYSLAPIDVYYHYLNCGFKLAMSSGSDKMALNPPMGSARTYVRTDAPLTYASWIEGIRKGHTFATDYPLHDSHGLRQIENSCASKSAVTQAL